MKWRDSSRIPQPPLRNCIGIKKAKSKNGFNNNKNNNTFNVLFSSEDDDDAEEEMEI